MIAWDRLKTAPPTLTGQQAQLIPMTGAHVESLYLAGRAAEIWTYMPVLVQDLADMERIVREALRNREQGSEMPFVIYDRETDRIVGSTRFMEITPAHRTLEIGWTWLAPDVWRTRINTECKYLLLRYSFETLRAIRVQLKTDLRNLRSQQAIERLGAVREGA
ncbi:MAG TPA: GNAT family N-acetyltransferase, partial [Chthonomonadaceae bacterium]|nr:GNAT family N-acetyltransferase [Chthonomonadaceae bacterium]